MGEEGFLESIGWGAKETWADLRESVDAGIEDVKEVTELADDFVAISEVRDYFREHQEQLDDIDVIDVFRRPDRVKEQIEKADQNIVKALDAIKEIQKTNLRFSQDYLGETVKELQGSLDDLNGTLTNLFHDIANPSDWKGRWLKKAMSGKKYRKLSDLSLKIKSLEADAHSLKKGLEALVDPALEESTNNAILNQYLGAEEYYEGAKEDYEEAKKSVDRIRRVIKAINRLKSYLE